MARITIEDCLKKEENRFALVHLAAKRVRQLLKGAKPLVNAPENKEVVVALREIAAGKVFFKKKTLDSNNTSKEILEEKNVCQT
ncbi:MAG: DNA-directed RNA polymerase subunit omega [Deltaproteobacteria bacterium]|jgi:DNA-directed RNA polymerase omega subunit|nr:MAG: DNA-directed RNA polymerase subunit omega [Deltaproteobacteria bacterium]